jgi:parallel beta-helix repeat protein
MLCIESKFLSPDASRVALAELSQFNPARESPILFAPILIRRRVAFLLHGPYRRGGLSRLHFQRQFTEEDDSMKYLVDHNGRCNRFLRTALITGIVLLVGCGAGWSSKVMAATYTVTNTQDSGPGSLRQAISYANTDPGASTILFSIPGFNVHTINLLTPLPAIENRSVNIDATTQPGYRGAPLIELTGYGSNYAQVSYGLLFINSSNSMVRGLCINRFRGNLIEFRGGQNNSVVENYLGTDPTGTRNIGQEAGSLDAATGILLDRSERNTIARNLISGNNRGVAIYGSPVALGALANNVVQGNRIGTDVNGMRSLGNRVGVEINNSSVNIIGGAGPSERNIISGNSVEGVLIQGGEANVTGGNFIGTAMDGVQPLPNRGPGVHLRETRNNAVGRAEGGYGNVIAFNDGPGVRVESGNSNSILSNSIYSNNGLGIGLDPFGATPNDFNDTDYGANDMQNAPELLGGNTYNNGATVTGRLNSTPNTTFRLEFFSNAACDPSGYGEGQALVGTKDVTTDPGGNVTFTANLSLATFASTPPGTVYQG